MLSDGLTSLQADGKARDEVEVLDVAQMLLASVKRATDLTPHWRISSPPTPPRSAGSSCGFVSSVHRPPSFPQFAGEFQAL